MKNLRGDTMSAAHKSSLWRRLIDAVFTMPHHVQ